MYKLNEDLGVYYTRVIIQAVFERNVCLISHCNQVSMGISVNAGIDNQLIMSTVSIITGIRFCDF